MTTEIDDVDVLIAAAGGSPPIKATRKPVDTTSVSRAAAALMAKLFDENSDMSKEDLFDLMADKFCSDELSGMFSKKLPASAREESKAALKDLGRASSSKGSDTEICQATAKSTGKPCSHKAKEGSDYCGIHKNFGSATASTASREIIVCASYKKGDGLPCTRRAKEGADYCSMHMENPILEPVAAAVKVSCAGKTIKGSSCLKNARAGFHTCSMHTGQEPSNQ
jgi:hypothetical protein